MNQEKFEKTVKGINIGMFIKMMEFIGVVAIQPFDEEDPLAYRPFGTTGFFTFLVKRFLMEGKEDVGELSMWLMNNLTKEEIGRMIEYVEKKDQPAILKAIKMWEKK